MPCAQKLAGNAVKDAHSRHLSDVNSAVFHCVDKCVVNGPASPNGMEGVKRSFMIYFFKFTAPLITAKHDSKQFTFLLYVCNALIADTNTTYVCVWKNLSFIIYEVKESL